MSTKPLLLEFSSSENFRFKYLSRIQYMIYNATSELIMDATIEMKEKFWSIETEMRKKFWSIEDDMFYKHYLNLKFNKIHNIK